jgi:acyl dehydratase
MPIHLDVEFARKVGLPGIIVHGLCTMAFASHAVISQICPHDPARLRRLAVRFSAPALPSHTISTSTWRTDAGSYSFETVASDGARVITDGRAEFSS